MLTRTIWVSCLSHFLQIAPARKTNSLIDSNPDALI
jgi:hypothetical protein